ncbi:hypothetical protein CQ12_37690 [Bradyrhizobium jicamae]|uniref:Uncharacterized protein n=1 Tax=Bradyrhizobium jicamae TaxID=280332 RepID=A0A0R3LBD5_9BRAD|nr:hypothetical protein [Bradyrhizobium jicamae]KRR02435.1 hypothetical protein CQ12_37690 [Bradyrhizobium jicamae]
MSKKWTLLALIFSLYPSGAPQANPLDSPDIVYIDGLPCNRACQSYMAWSDRALSARHRGERETVVVVPVEAEPAGPDHASPARVTRHGASASRSAPRSSMAASKTRPTNAKKAAAPSPAAAGKNAPPATPPVAGDKAVAGGQTPERKLEIPQQPVPNQTAAIAAPQPAEAPKSEAKSEVKPEAKPEVEPEAKTEAKTEAKSEVILPPPATLELAATPAAPETAATPAAVASAPATRTLQQQVVEATGLADLVTAIGTGREAASNLDNPEIEPARDSAKTASTSPDEQDNLVALVLARPEIGSLSDLNNKNIAIEEKQSASSGRVSAAFMAAGAAEVQFSEGQRGAIDRLISGEVPAAVLTLASREAAAGFPDIKGFKTFRVPLAQKARL